MFRMLFANAVSSMLIGFIMYPFLRLLQSFTWFNVKYVVGLLCVMAFIKLAHSLPPNGLYARPKGACDCGIANDGGNYEGRSGMPSGHVMTTAYVLFVLSLRSKNMLSTLVSCCVIVAMMYARLVKKCHTMPQVIMGVLLGLVSSAVATYF